MYPLERDIVINSGESFQVGDYTLTLEGMHQDMREDHVSTRANVTVAQGATYLTTLNPEIRHYANFEQSYGIPAVRPGLREDLYLILAGWSEDQTQVTFRVLVNALANFLWLGGLIFLAGGTLAFWPRTKQQSKWHIVGGIVVLALLLGAAWAMWIAPQSQASEGTAMRPSVGQPAPDFRLTLLDGSTLSLADLRGQVVVLNIWASWCPPCTEELPALQSVWTSYQDADVVLVGAAYQENEKDVRAAVESYGLTYPIGLDTNDRIASTYGITGVPETFIIDAEGRIAYVHIGPITVDQLTQEMESLVK
jgi:peroxiredoxin